MVMVTGGQVAYKRLLFCIAFFLVDCRYICRKNPPAMLGIREPNFRESVRALGWVRKIFAPGYGRQIRQSKSFLTKYQVLKPP